MHADQEPLRRRATIDTTVFRDVCVWPKPLASNIQICERRNRYDNRSIEQFPSARDERVVIEHWVGFRIFRLLTDDETKVRVGFSKLTRECTVEVEPVRVRRVVGLFVLVASFSRQIVEALESLWQSSANLCR